MSDRKHDNGATAGRRLADDDLLLVRGGAAPNLHDPPQGDPDESLGGDG